MKRKILITFLLLVGFVFCNFLLPYFLQFNLLKDHTSLAINMTPYKKAELQSSQLHSRQWMQYAIAIEKKKNFPPPAAARLYAYVASIYSDTLDDTKNSNQATLATAELVNILVPSEQAETLAFQENLQKKGEPTETVLNERAEKILALYKKRTKDDKFVSTWQWTPPDPKTHWFIRNGVKDGAHSAGEWLPWILSKRTTFSVPPPPTRGSLQDALDLQKVQYAVDHRTSSEFDSIYFWHGASGFIKGQAGDNVTPAGVWQNILFIEQGKKEDDFTYAKHQKLLAQSIADSFIFCWRVKYTYWTQRPSMRIENLFVAVGDPPFPSYVSGHATISSTASTVLSALYPDKKKLWERLSQDARNSRLLAGIHFDSDNQVGNYLGIKIGQDILKRINRDQQLSPVHPPPKSDLNNVINYGILLTQSHLKNTVTFLSKKIHVAKGKYLGTFTKLSNSDIQYRKPIQGLSFVDYNNDKKLDVFIAGNPVKLYKNAGNGKFIDQTKKANLSNQKAYAGIFADYDNDGCSDLYLVKYGEQRSLEDIGENDSLLHNTCKGTFTDVTKKSNIVDSLHGNSASWADYDNDGFLDLYVANYGLHIPIGVTNEPNILYHNNGNGTFTNVTEELAVVGLPTCFTDNFFKSHSKANGDKESYQPLWFDYNNDNKIDLFVTNDRGINVLYKNTGSGFQDVTSQAGLCILGTGMGVTANDYDNNGWTDLYITNISYNYLYTNQKGKFSEHAYEVTQDVDAIGWGTHFFDYDNDNDIDIYATNGTLEVHKEIDKRVTKQDSLFTNDGKGIFSNVALQEGIINENSGRRAAAFGDYNNDGFLDILLGGSQKDNSITSTIYKNKGNKNNWITIRLIGKQSNRDSIGAKIAVTAGGKKQTREVINSSSFRSQNSPWQTFGLGQTNKIDSLEIQWPSGTKKILKNVAVNKIIDISE